MVEEATAVINRHMRRIIHWTLSLFGVLFVLQHVISYFLYVYYFDHTVNQWLTEILIADLVLLSICALALWSLYRLRVNLTADVNRAIGAELHRLRAADNRAKSLQAMAAILSATLSFERVVEQALDACSLALEDMGIARETLVGVVFLYDGDALVPLARRRFLGDDDAKVLLGEAGVVGAALHQAEPTVTDNPAQDPELRAFSTFADCLTAVCIPLRAGFQLFGVMVLGTHVAVQFDEDHFDLFNAVADQAVIALQNAQLYQRLEAEKQRLIDANEAARRELAADLHDGPVQKVSALSMRLRVIRSLVSQDPARALEEINKVDELALRTVKELRGMLFTLRPLVLETRGLGPALQAVLDQIHESDGIEMQLIGGENGDLLSPAARGVVFSIIEEALSNARKHANAGVIEVRMWREEDLFVARVRDDGQGFDMGDVNRDYSSRKSLGMLNMHERAERIDGSLSVESAAGDGTTVTLVVPLEKYGRIESSEPVLEAAD